MFIYICIYTYTGGGYGNVRIGYNIKHFSTNDSDLSATAIYTSSQTLSFSEGVVEQSFLIRIINDNLVEENEVFQVYLDVPKGGGYLGVFITYALLDGFMCFM
jgi:hypothetical protein